jgi:glutathione synthase
MKLAFIVDPPDSFNLKKDSSFAMMREAARRGHELHVLEQADIFWEKHAVSGYSRRIHLTGTTPGWYRAEDAQASALHRFDAILMRKDPPFDMEYVYSTYLLEMAERQGARVLNRPRAIRDYNEKLAIARFAQFTAPTLVTRRMTQLSGFLLEHGDIILKPLDGMGGSSIFRVREGDPNTNVIIETLTAQGSRTIMAQRYIPDIIHGDKRILVIGGKPVSHCLARIPQQGENRGNLAAGGTGVARPLTARDREIAETLGPQLMADGLLLVGLDVIGDFLTEVNVTSPTCFQEITTQSGVDVAGIFMNSLEKLASQPI